MQVNEFTQPQKFLLRQVTAEARFIEGWMSGTYVVAGIFAIPAEGLTQKEMELNIPVMREATQKAKRGWWPRGMSGMFLFPFYLGREFDPEIIAWVQRRRPYRWAIWHEPILYDLTRNAVWMRADYGHFGSAFHPFVFRLYRRALGHIAETIQKTRPDFINGAPVKTPVS